MKNPIAGDVIKGTSGARKGRASNPKQKGGKSGGFRYIYVYLERSERIYLLYIYSKKDVKDLTPEQEKAFGKIVGEIKKAFSETK